MGITDRAATLREVASTSPGDADLDALVGCLRSDTAAERLVGAEVLGRLALAGRDVAPAVDAIDLDAWELALFEQSTGLAPGRDDEVIIPRTVAFAGCSLVVTGHAAPAALSELVAVHERLHPEFDADGRHNAAVREVGWALASALIVDDGRLDALLELIEHDDRTVRRVGAAGLSDVAGEYRSVHGHAVPRREELAETAAELLAGSDDERLRYRGGFTLYEFGTEEPTLLEERLPRVRAALGDESETVRTEAIGMVRLAGDAAAIGYLSRLADDDPSETVRAKAADALDAIRDGD